MVLIVYHYLNVCYYGGPMLKKKKKKLCPNKFYQIKLRLLQFTDVTDFDNDPNFTSVS